MTTTPPPQSCSEPLPLQTISPPRTTTKPPHQIPSPWSHTETIHLITAYTQKWYSLNKGQLKATQWEHLSILLATRCGYATPSKTAIQCRHKIEKLRKRYRAEKLKPNPTAWEYFHLMHALHHGPGPGPALPLAMVQNPNSGYEYEEEEEGGLVNYAPRTVGNSRSSTGFGHSVGRRSEIDDEDKEEMVNLANYGRPIATARYNPNMNPIFLRRHVELDHEDDEEEVYLVSKSNNVRDQKRRGYFERSEGSESEGDEREERGLALAGEIRRFAKKVVRMEERKMEMMRETERCRMEMEKRTTEMIHEAQRKVMDTIAKAFGSHDKKKMKTEMD